MERACEICVGCDGKCQREMRADAGDMAAERGCGGRGELTGQVEGVGG